jgi:WD40 repeat protein
MARSTPLVTLAVPLVLIGSLARAAEPPRTDALGDPLPPRALLRIGTSRLGHADRVDHAALSADGKSLATAATFTDPSVCVWNVPDGKRLFRQELPAEDDARGIALSPDGKKLAALTRRITIDADATLFVWDVASGQRLLRLPLGSWKLQRVAAMAFSPDGNAVAVAGRDVAVIDLVGGKVRRTPAGEDDLWSVAIRAGDGLLAAAGNGVHFWGPGTGKDRGSAPKQPARALAFAPDGKTLAVGAGKAVLLRRVTAPPDAAKPVELGPARELGAFPQTVTQIAFSPDGRSLLTGDAAGECRVFEVAAGKLLHRAATGRGQVAALAFAGGKPLAVTRTHDGRAVRLWDVAAGKELLPDRGHLHGISALTFGPAGAQLISAGEDVRFWDAGNGKQRRRCEGDDLVRQLVLSPDGKEVAAVGRRVTWWGVPGGERLRAYEPKADYGTTVLADGRTVAAPVLERVKDKRSATLFATRVAGTVLVDGPTGREVRRLAADQPRLRASPDGRALAAFGSGVQFWDLPRGSRLHEGENQSWVSEVVFSADGQFAAVSQRETVTVWELATRRSARAWKVPREEFIPGYPGVGVALAFGPDGRSLAAGTPRGTVLLWDVDTGKPLPVLKGHLGSVRALAFRPDGRVLASGSADRTILLWDVADSPSPAKAELLRPAEVDRLWEQLASSDPVKGLEAVARLAAGGPAAGGALARHLSPVPAAGAKRLARLIADLDSEEFTVRRDAAAELAALGELAEPALRKARETGPSAEVRRQLDQLLSRAGHRSAETVRAGRAVRALERIGDGEARRLLERLAAGAPEARLTQDAQAALRRLATRSKLLPPAPGAGGPP